MDPDQWVVRGDRTVDSMCHFRMGLTYFDDPRGVREGGAGENDLKLSYYLTVGGLAVGLLAEGTVPLGAQTNIPGTAGPEMVPNLSSIWSAGDPAIRRLVPQTG